MVFQAFRKGIASGVIGAGQGSGLLTETIPFLKRILSPSLRSVSVQLLTPREKYDLNHTVQIMADFGLIYNQLKKPDGMYEYNLEPDLNLMGKFNGGYSFLFDIFCDDIKAFISCPFQDNSCPLFSSMYDFMHFSVLKSSLSTEINSFLMCLGGLSY